ncbi:MAG TPA: alanine--glyoxylate aminotransferase family protein [Gemmatimonadales bacterium]|nr:alanine--glyoxylate aminotransferase family protein [Gemmatimonadales bacterium]
MATTAKPAAGFGRFFLPGPTEVLPEILAAQTRPMIGHRGKSMEQLIADMAPGLQRIFRTARPVYISSSSATGLMEAAIRNCGGRRVLSLVNGAFSERFYKIAQANGCDATALEVPLGQVHTPEQLAAALEHGRYDAVTVVHSETSTGALNPIEALARVTHAAGDVLLLVDSVTGVAGARVESDAWDLDFVLTGSQKALALPPGLALGVAQPRALERAKQTTNRGTYFDLVEFESYIVKHQTPNTPALSLMYALAAQVARIEKEGIEERWARHEAMARRTWAWAESMRARGVAIDVLAPAGYRSPTVTCLTMPPGRKGSEVNEAMKARGFTISAGYGALKDATIRIGHMGDHTVAELDVLLGALEEVLAP